MVTARWRETKTYLYSLSNDHHHLLLLGNKLASNQQKQTLLIIMLPLRGCERPWRHNPESWAVVEFATAHLAGQLFSNKPCREKMRQSVEKTKSFEIFVWAKKCQKAALKPIKYQVSCFKCTCFQFTCGSTCWWAQFVCSMLCWVLSWGWSIFWIKHSWHCLSPCWQGFAWQTKPHETVGSFPASLQDHHTLPGLIFELWLNLLRTMY